MTTVYPKFVVVDNTGTKIKIARDEDVSNDAPVAALNIKTFHKDSASVGRRALTHILFLKKTFIEVNTIPALDVQTLEAMSAENLLATIRQPRMVAGTLRVPQVMSIADAQALLAAQANAGVANAQQHHPMMLTICIGLRPNEEARAWLKKGVQVAAVVAAHFIPGGSF